MWSGCRRIGWNTEVGGGTQHVDLMGETRHARRHSQRFHGGQLDFEDGSSAVSAEFGGFKLERLALKAKSSFLLC